MNFFRVENFLHQHENEQILSWAIANEDNFTKSSITTQVEDYRRSKVAFDFPCKDLIVERVLALLPVVTKALGVELIALELVECQMTAHGDGDYFKVHSDHSNDPRCANRLISYVYYFHNQPLAFVGGELAIYDSESSVHIQPANNTLVCFPSSCLHEVLPVCCCNGRFEDSRFTVNGWLRDAPINAAPHTTL